MIWDVRRRLEGENVAVAVILGVGVGVGGLGRGEEGEGGFSLGAKKREITCCFCFPMAMLDLARFRILPGPNQVSSFSSSVLKLTSLSLLKLTVTSFSSFYDDIGAICCCVNFRDGPKNKEYYFYNMYGLQKNHE